MAEEIVYLNGSFVQYVEGVKLVIPSTQRIPPQCLEPKAKINNKMNHNMAIFEAKQVDP